jgi:hypothetical protein
MPNKREKTPFLNENPGYNHEKIGKEIGHGCKAKHVKKLQGLLTESGKMNRTFCISHSIENVLEHCQSALDEARRKELCQLLTVDPWGY